MRILPVIMLTICFATTAVGQDFKSSPTSVVLYKNGLSWIVEEGRGEAETEWTGTLLHAVPLLGTLGVTPRSETRVLEVKGNPRISAGEFSTLSSVMASRSDKRLWIRSGGATRTGRFAGLVNVGPGGVTAVSLETKDGTLLIPVAKIEQLEMQPEGKEEPVTADKKIRIRLKGKGEKFHLGISYMTSAIGWIPSYRLEMGQSDKGKLTMNALVINNALDLASVDAQFATGESTFPFRYEQSPLFNALSVTEGIMRGVMNHTTGARGGQAGWNFQAMNAMPAQQMMSASSGPGEVTPSEETYLYGPTELTLARGERAMLPIGAGKVPARLIYSWKVPMYLGDLEQGNDAWLAALITNKLDFPLTTGPILITKTGRPLGQGVVNYTHKGGEAVIPISIASAVLCKAEEREEDRSNSSLKFLGSRWARVTVKGTLTINNRRGKDITVRVEKPVMGKVKAAGNKGKVDEQIISTRDPNPKSTIHWTIDVKKGKKVKLAYEYEALHQY